MIPIQISLSTDVKHSLSLELKHLIGNKAYKDAAVFAEHNAEQIGPTVAKLVIELSGLSEIAPDAIIQRKELEILNILGDL
jgi:hypothetical protein